MADAKTRPADAGVEAYIDAIDDAQRRGDCRTLLTLMHRATGEPAVMWGAGMVGFGSYHYRYASGHEGDSFLAGFASRKRELTVYVMAGFERYEALLAKLGKHKVAKSCLYLNQLADVDLVVLEELVARSAAQVAKDHAG